MKLPGYCQKCAVKIPKSRKFCDGCRPVSKYRNKPVVHEGQRFDSRAEFRRWSQLKLLELAGKISNLEVHPRRPLVVNGKTVGHFRPDFIYLEPGRGVVVEDVKGQRRMTADFTLRAALFEAIYGVPVQVVRA